MRRPIHDGKFSQQDLEKITELVRDGNIEVAAKHFGVSFATLHKFRKVNPKLQVAIKKGRDERLKTKGGFEVALAKFQSFSKEELQAISDVAYKGGLELVIEEYSTSTYIINKCRKACPELDWAILSGLRKRGKKHKKRYVSRSAHNARGSNKKPPKELIDSTMKGIDHQADVALTNFREYIKQRKLKEEARRLCDGEYDNMI